VITLPQAAKYLEAISALTRECACCSSKKVIEPFTPEIEAVGQYQGVVQYQAMALQLAEEFALP
jgi:hypothetical protein